MTACKKMHCYYCVYMVAMVTSDRKANTSQTGKWLHIWLGLKHGSRRIKIMFFLTWQIPNLKINAKYNWLGLILFISLTVSDIPTKKNRLEAFLLIFGFPHMVSRTYLRLVGAVCSYNACTWRPGSPIFLHRKFYFRPTFIEKLLIFNLKGKNRLINR